MRIPSPLLTVAFALVVLVVQTTVAIEPSKSATPAPEMVADACQADTGPPLEASSWPIQRDASANNVPLDGKVIVSPLHFDVRRAMQAGESFTCIVSIYNRRSEPSTFRLVPLGVVGSRSPNTGGFEFVNDDDERWPETAGNWIEPKKPSIEVRPRDVVRVPFTVRVPHHPPSGAAYGAVGVAMPTLASVGNSIGVESVIATIILIPLPGGTAADVQLRSAHAPRVRWGREAWRLTASLDNVGDLHAVTAGRVRIRSIFGNEVASVPIQRQTVLPGGREAVEVIWDSLPWIGLYRWDARVASEPNEVLDDTTRSVASLEGWIVVLPPWWVLIIATAMLSFLLTNYLRKRALVGSNDNCDSGFRLSGNDGPDDDDASDFHLNLDER